MCLFLTVLWVGLQYVIVAFPDHTHLLFDKIAITFEAIQHNLEILNCDPLIVQ